MELTTAATDNPDQHTVRIKPAPKDWVHLDVTDMDNITRLTVTAGHTQLGLRADPGEPTVSRREVAECMDHGRTPASVVYEFLCARLDLDITPVHGEESIQDAAMRAGQEEQDAGTDIPIPFQRLQEAAARLNRAHTARAADMADAIARGIEKIAGAVEDHLATQSEEQAENGAEQALTDHDYPLADTPPLEKDPHISLAMDERDCSSVVTERLSAWRERIDTIRPEDPAKADLLEQKVAAVTQRWGLDPRPGHINLPPHATSAQVEQWLPPGEGPLAPAEYHGLEPDERELHDNALRSILNYDNPVRDAKPAMDVLRLTRRIARARHTIHVLHMERAQTETPAERLRRMADERLAD